MFSGGPGSGVYVSHDGGDTWTPHRRSRHAAIRRSARSMSPSRPRNSKPHLRPDPNRRPGFALALRRRRRKLGRRELAARPDRTRGLLHSPRRLPGNDDEVLRRQQLVSGSPSTAARTSTSSAGAATPTTSGSIPRIPIAFVMTHDGGMYITTVHGRRLPPGQPAHRPDVPRRRGQQVPYYFYSNMQDDGTMRGPTTSWSRSRRARQAEARMGDRGSTAGRLRVAASPFPIPTDPQHRVGHLLRQQGHALRCAHARWRARSVRGCTLWIRRPTR